MAKEPSFGTPRAALTCLLSNSFRTMSIDVFPDYFTLSHFLVASCCFQKKNTIFIKFCTKFWVKQAKILVSKCTKCSK